MKKILLFSVLSIIYVFSSAQKISFKNSWGKQGFNLISEQKSSVEIVYCINEFSLKDKTIKGEEMTEVVLPGNFLFNNAGMPNLPGNGKNIAVPKGAKVKLSITDYETETYKNVSVIPAPKIPFDTEKADLKYIKNEKVYNQNKYYPENPVKLSEKHQIRGLDFITIGITPFKYNPVKKELIVYKNIKVKIEFSGGNGEFSDNRLRSRWWDPILEDDILNYKSLPKVDYSKRNTNTKDNEAEYLILTLDNADFIQWADSIAEFRRKQGISTEVYTVSEVGGNSVSAIETWVDNAYNTWSNPPAAVLILADYGESTDGITAQRYDHPYQGTYITDNKYADVDGDDLPDIAFARITARNAGELETMIKKDLNYERNPPVSSDFYDHPISALGWQTERWFQICSEVIGGFWSSQLGKSPVRINAVYDGNPNSDPWSSATNTSDVVDYFGPNGLNYIPASPSELGGWTGGNASAINNALNNGSFMLQHRDHGGESGWGEPAYSSSNINGLTNTNLSFIMSINCLTGRFDYGSEVFAEKFHRYTYNGNGSGALGLIAATQVSYSFVNDTYVWGAYDNMWPNFMPGETANPESRFILPAFANVAGKNFLYQSGWPYNTDSKQITYRLFHHHGDAFLNVYSEVPENLSVTAEDVHTFGNTQYNVTADNGAFIALSYYDETNEKTVIVSTGESDGGLISLDMTNCPPVGTNMLLTITKQNYFRYTKNVLVISPSGPYVIADHFIINDGNNNSAEYGESFNLDITLKNVGTQNSEGINATLTSGDTYVQSLTNSTNISYSDLAPDQSETSSGYFTIQIANNIPDQHTIILNLEVSDNSAKATYNSTISFKVNAPVISIGNVFVTNDDNADGRIDPGETGDINFTITNSGHADADFSGTLSEASDPNNYLTLGGTTVAPISIAASASQDFSFTGASADVNTPLGSPVGLQLDAAAGASSQYTDVSNQDLIIGIVPIYPISDQGTLNVCTGTFYDSGLDIGEYGNSENYTMTFMPSNGNASIAVDFISFDLESGYDYLHIYDGPDTNAPEVPGSPFSGTTNPGTFTGTNGLTFNFTSDGSVTRAGWEASVSCVESFEITFNVTDGTNPIEGAAVTFEGSTLNTDASGHAVFNVLDGTNLPYSVTKTGYYDANGTVNADANKTVDVTMNLIPTYDITFSVTDGTNPIEGANVTFNGSTISTDASGYAVFNSVEEGTGLAYSVAKTGYYLVNGTTDADADKTVDVVMSLIPSYDITFSVTDGTNSIEGATVTFNGSALYTDASGLAIFNNVEEGTGLSYWVTKTGYQNANGMTDADADKTVDVVLTPTYTITFNVTDGTNPIAGANVNFDGRNFATDSNGDAVFANCPQASAIAYTVSKSGYQNATGTVDADADKTVNVTMSSPLSISNPNNTIRIIPNPNKGLFTIKTKGLNTANSTVEIYSVSGKLIYQKNMNVNAFNIDLGNQAKGIYFLKINSGNRVFNSKLVIK